ncbi:hypothetical protein HON58_02865 [Candidatus Peregrinibacteria bacterium]|nr:hypothetical protein [Candidatus Peregrinibacteria bacterium]
MKKFVTFLALTVLSLGAFSGCGIDDSFQQEPDLESHKGILIEQSSSDDIKGTHLLETDGDNLALRSLALNLSSAKYLNNEVEVMGVFNEEDEVLEVTGISVMDVLSEDSEKVEFVEYSNTDLGLKLKYYSDWEVQNEVGSADFVAPSADEFEPDMVSISRYTFSYQPKVDEEGNSDTPLGAFMKQTFPLIENSEDYMRLVGPQKHDAIVMETDGADVDYYLFRNNQIYTVSFISSEDYVAGNKKIFNEMLAEFVFTGYTVDDPEEAVVEEDVIGFTGEEQEEEEVFAMLTSFPQSDLKMDPFESLSYEFQGLYPASWYYAGGTSAGQGVLRHYGFSDESIAEDNGNELIGLDLISGSAPSGKIHSYAGRDFTVLNENGLYTVYTSVAGKTYRVFGDDEHGDLILSIAASIDQISESGLED